MNLIELKEKAKNLFKLDYWQFVLVYLVFSGIFAFSTSSYGIPILVIGGPLTAGFIMFNLNYIRGNNGTFLNIFDSFKRFTDYFLTFLLKFAYVFLWTLLFIVPGIIKALSYSQALYIMYDNPGIGPKDALIMSEKMMDGHKMELFKLHLSFLGWHILGILTFGVLKVFYVGPYYNAALALYYEELKLHNK